MDMGETRPTRFKTNFPKNQKEIYQQAIKEFGNDSLAIKEAYTDGLNQTNKDWLKRGSLSLRDNGSMNRGSEGLSIFWRIFNRIAYQSSIGSI